MFTVLWTAAAQQALANVWLAAKNRNAVTQAAADIDRLLAADPMQAGRPFIQGALSLLVPPLAADYIVDVPNATVHVFDVWLLEWVIAGNGFAP